VHVSPSTLKENGELGRSHLEDGTRLSAESARRLSCDASVVEVTRGEQGEVLNVGRKRRTIPPALRRALEIRDGGCRFPGCGSRFCDTHHVIHWEDGGETSLRNCLLVCAPHHRALHEEGFRVRLYPDGRAQFYDRQGWPLPDFVPQPEISPDPVAALIRQNRARGVDPDGWCCSSKYERGSDVPWSVEARVWEALDR
jgi:hypothetical protein